MRMLHRRLGCYVALASGLWLGQAVQAQMPGGTAPGGMNAALLKLFGDVKAFTAKAEVRVLDSSQQEMVSLPMDFSLLDEKIRVEMDMTQAKGSALPPGTVESLKQMGIAQMVSIVRPDKKLTYVVYPTQKAMLAMPLPKEEVDAAGKPPKIEKTLLGKETLDGHACLKNKVVITDDKGKSVEATVWNATDMKDFPIQIQTKEQENTSIIQFKQVKMTPPDEKQFEPPPGCTEYQNQQELMQVLMKRAAEGAQKK